MEYMQANWYLNPNHKAKHIMVGMEDEFQSPPSIQPFIILLMTHWTGWDAVNCLNQSAPTQSEFKKF
eukprot:scaffold8192_cov81-Cyclotella_meneghiniana.AAC.1